MKTQNKVTSACTVVLAMVLSTGSLAHHPNHETTPVTVASDVDMINAEVRKVDKDAKKITLKHEEIKSLDMPGMTMVFQVKDAALLDKTKAGDKVRFKVIKDGNAYVVTEIKMQE